MHLHAKVKILLAGCYADMGLIKHIRRSEQMSDLGNDEDRMLLDEYTIYLIYNSDFEAKEEESIDLVDKLPQNEPLQKFLA